MKRVITKDNSVTFYSDKYGETYHSISGAVEEAVKKFAEPALSKELIAKGRVCILDICFGLGYNSAAAIDLILSKNPNCKIEIIGLEKDVEILNKITDLNPNFENYNIVKALIKTKFNLNKGNIKIKLIIGDAQDTVKIIKGTQFDVVFLDPFSPPKNPELWTLDFFKDVKKLMAKDAILTTYSCARIARDNLRKAGFEVKDGPVVGRRAPGTVATTTAIALTPF